MKTFKIFFIVILALIGLTLEPTKADYFATSQSFSSGGNSMASRFGSTDSMAYRNIMADGPEYVIDEYYEQGCVVKVMRFWRPAINGYVVRTARTCQ